MPMRIFPIGHRLLLVFKVDYREVLEEDRMRIVRSFLRDRCLRGSGADYARMLGVLLAFAMLFNCSSTLAQTITGAVRGTVTDPSGAALAGVSVTAINTATNVKTSTLTNHDGIYNIQFLPIGPYVITVTSAGFETHSLWRSIRSRRLTRNCKSEAPPPRSMFHRTFRRCCKRRMRRWNLLSPQIRSRRCR